MVLTKTVMVESLFNDLGLNKLEGLTRLFKVLEQQLIPMNERVARRIGSRREPLSEQAIRVVVETRLPLFLRIGTRRPCESLAITLIQRHFRWAMVFRQSVASTD